MIWADFFCYPDPDPDPGGQNDADPTGSGSTLLLTAGCAGHLPPGDAPEFALETALGSHKITFSEFYPNQGQTWHCFHTIQVVGGGGLIILNGP